MSASGNSIAQLSYGSFYLSTLAFGYLSTEPNNPILQYLPHFELAGRVIEPIHILYFLTMFTFIGALESHGIARAIYGPEGPEERPKHKTIQIRHSLAIILRENPENIPVVPCRIAHRGFLKETLDYMGFRLRKSLQSVQFDEDGRRGFGNKFGQLPQKHRLETGYEQLLQFKPLIGWRNLSRILLFTPMGILKHMTWASLVALVILIARGSYSYAALLLVMAHAVLLFRGFIWSSIPNVYNFDALDDQFTPEYENHEEYEK